MVVSEEREFLAGEEMANILVIKKKSNNGFFCSLILINSSSIFFSSLSFRFLLSIHESVAALLDFFVQKS